MKLKTMSAASNLPFAPSRQFLSKETQRVPPPGYFYYDGAGFKVDIDHPDWDRLLKKRAIDAKIGLNKGAKLSDLKPLSAKKSKEELENERKNKAELIKKKHKSEDILLLEAVNEAIIAIIPGGQSYIEAIQFDIYARLKSKIRAQNGNP